MGIKKKTHGDNRKGTWGGKRERKTKKEPTKVMRIPESKVNQVKALIEDQKKVNL